MIHKHLVDRLVQVLIEIFRDGAYADKIISRELKANKKWGSRDRRFFAEQVYDCVRWWRKYWFILGEDPSFNPNKVLKFWALNWTLKGEEIPSWPELENFKVNSANLKLAEQNPAIRESIPDWLFERGEKELGAQSWISCLRSLNQVAPVDLRVNSLKANLEQVRESLATENILTEPVARQENALTLVERKNVFISKAFQLGWFEVQDRASQRVAPFMQISPGLRVVDACAGAGGKSLHIANLLKNKGKLISMDIHDWKLNELKERARRNGVDVIETKLIEGTKTIKRMEKSFDRVLLDVPCSGLGVLRRNPDTKWKLTQESVAVLIKTQAEILESYSRLLKVGGKLIYATCSLMPSENEQQVEAFLKNNSQFQCEEMLRIDPDQGQGDGFFAARMILVS
jgi:16S rRNA (cytosine967-C5)-methyltransferase